MRAFDYILEDSNDDDAMECARGMVWDEMETQDAPTSVYRRYIGSDNGVGVWYDYAADYYWFEDEVTA